jgi:hypothetical protein
MLVKTAGSITMIAILQGAASIMPGVTWRSARGAVCSFSVAIVWTMMMKNDRELIPHGGGVGVPPSAWRHTHSYSPIATSTWHRSPTILGTKIKNASENNELVVAFSLL